MMVEKEQLYREPVRALIIIIVLTFAAEALVMLLLLTLPPIGPFVRSLLDASLLVILILPALYFFSFRPLLSQLTECKLAERNLEKSRMEARLLSKRLMEVLEEERKRISRDLHDELGQRVTSIKMKVGLLRKLASTDDARLQTQTDDIQESLDKALDAILHISFALRPSMLDDLGLVPAIGSLLEKFQETSGIRCDWECAVRNGDCSPEVSTTAYRVLQEALTNVMRHAGVSSVKVGLNHREGRLILTVEDKGRGFDLSRFDINHCLGLINMRERVELAGGKITILSGHGLGTRVRMELPVQAHREVAQ